MSWLVLLPPLIVAVIALVTRYVKTAFTIGIIVGVVVATDGHILNAVVLMTQRLWESSGLSVLISQGLWASDSLLLFLFLIFIGVLILLMQQTGAAYAFSCIARRRVKSRFSAEISSLVLSLLFFVDDYFSTLTVGSVMCPLARVFKLHPVKLAFLVTAMATPLVLLSPVSSWMGQIVLQIKLAGIEQAPGALVTADPFYVYLNMIPFILYSMILVISTWFIVLRRISFGPMALYDKEHSFSLENNDSPVEQGRAGVVDFIFPVLLLLVLIIAGLLYTGECICFGGTRTFMDAMRHALAQQALAAAGFITVCATAIFYYSRGLIRFREISLCFVHGIRDMGPSVLMLLLAWTLSRILLLDVHTGDYLANMVGSVLHEAFIPAACFILAGLISWMLGSSWAAMSIMFPLVVPLLQQLVHFVPGTPAQDIVLLLPVLGATLSGCAMGTHMSLLSDNPILSATSTGAAHFEHVRTMTWYILPVAVSTAAAYVVLGSTIGTWSMISSWFMSLSVGLGGSLSLLSLGNYIFGKR